MDVARGSALAAMAVYHGAWDLDALGFAPGRVSGQPGWDAFAKVIAASFLALVGLSLVLAARAGLDRRAYLRRLAKVALAAGLVTVATSFAVPDAPVTFGILHCIAASSVLALPFLRAPVLVVIGAALACVGAPVLLRGEGGGADLPWWLGLSANPPDAVDFVPLLPWFGAVLAGLAGARLLIPRAEARGLAAWRPKGRVPRALAFAGRRSLLVYLVHQPLLIGALSLAALALGVSPQPAAVEGAAFVASCEAGCARAGSGAALCERRCACVTDRLKAEGLWERTLAGRLAPGEDERVAGAAGACAGG